MAVVSKITGVGSYLPPRVLTNFDLEKMLDTSDQWIRERTGIEKRHWVDPSMSTSDLALEASTRALASAGLDKKDLDMIIVATLSPDHFFPGTSCFLQDKLKVPEIATLDIRQQCTGFIWGLSIADRFIRTGTHKNILVVGSEIHSKGLDKTPKGRDVTVLFGDGAGACVVSAGLAKDSRKDPQIMTADLHSDGSFAKELWIPAPGFAFDSPDYINEGMLNEGLQFASMRGKVVFVNAVKRMAETLMTSLRNLNLKIEDIDFFLFHQANLRINQKVGEMLGIPEAKVFNTVQKYGNTTAATIPIGMDEAVRAGKLKPGMLVAAAAFGSGFTWGSLVFRY